jgi:hypothetical protein
MDPNRRVCLRFSCSSGEEIDGVVVVVGFIENLRLMNEGEGRRKGKQWCCWVHQGDVLDREKEREEERENRGILVHSYELSQLELPRQLISDVAVINWVKGRNFK